MSAGGVFKLITNDGKADRMIMATELLNLRIKAVICSRARAGLPDVTPTLADIERTHVLFVNAHFKPFAAIGYEYNSCNSNNGQAQFNGQVQFSIPQFGDFFSDMVLQTIFAATSATAGTVPTFPTTYIGAANQSTTSTAQISATENAGTGVYTKYTREYVDIQGTVLTVGAARSNFVRYCEFVGHRFMKKVKFEVNGNPLDEYTSSSYLMHEKVCVHPNKRVGWRRLVGQEVPVEAVSDLSAVSGASTFPSAIANLLDTSAAAVNGAPINSTVTARKLVSVLYGPQTPQATQPALEMWIPLLFWCNTDSRLAVPSVAIPFGQRYITIDTEAQSNLLFVAPGNLFLRLTVEQQTSAGANLGTAAAVAVTDVKKFQSLVPVLATGSVIDTTQTITSLKLYINNIFVNPEIHDLFIKRIGFSLIRVHREQPQRLSNAMESVLLSNLKWPIETMFVGFRPVRNIDASNTNQYRDWHRLSAVTDNILDNPSRSYGAAVIDDTVAFNAVGTKVKTFSSVVTNERLTYNTYTETVSTLNLVAHGIDIIKTTNTMFYRDYTSYTFGGDQLDTPVDLGLYIFNFCLYPGTYQPSGHINVSRAREFYLGYVSTYISASTPVDLVIVARAINFLLISDGSAVLRYST